MTTGIPMYNGLVPIIDIIRNKDNMMNNATITQITFWHSELHYCFEHPTPTSNTTTAIAKYCRPPSTLGVIISRVREY